MDKAQTIKTTAEELLNKMISSFEIDIEEENEVFHVVIKTEEDAPTVIGRHGETIRAIQKILEVMLYKTLGEPVNILVNVNDYREKQKERLQDMATQMAQNTKETGRPNHLRGLSSYERKVVHEYVTDTYPELATHSIGEGRDRHLVIDIKSNEGEQTKSENNTEE